MLQGRYLSLTFKTCLPFIHFLKSGTPVVFAQQALTRPKHEHIHIALPLDVFKSLKNIKGIEVGLFYLNSSNKMGKMDQSHRKTYFHSI